jgi:hypothetical protein
VELVKVQAAYDLVRTLLPKAQPGGELEEALDVLDDVTHYYIMAASMGGPLDPPNEDPI